jgi:phosphatidylinositol alpha-1,6-mannosyltransferase
MERLADDLQRALQPHTQLYLLAWGGSRIMLFFVLPWFFLRSCWLLLTKPIDVIQAFDGVISIICVPLKFIFKKPLCVIVHGLDVTYSNGLYRSLSAWSFGHADHIVCVSQATKEQLLKRGVVEEKITVIPLGITDDLYMKNRLTARKGVQKIVPEVTPNQKILLSVGRLVERKGLQWFISKVLPELVKAHPDVLLVVIGKGPMREAVKKEVKIRKLQNHVVLLGEASDATVQTFYNAADIFVMPNIRVAGDMEGFGRVLLEAALCQLPIVASNVDGIADAITSGQNGLLVAPKQAAEHLAALKRLLDKPAKARLLGEQARRYTWANNNWSVIAKRHLEVYQLVMEDQELL